jgi:hypothetical protein
VTQQILNVGTAGVVGSGDSAPVFGAKCNGNFTELYTKAATIPTAATPSTSIGLTPITGSTGHFMDAGSAPALSQAITPTMTGAWTFSYQSGIPVTIAPATAVLGMQIQAGVGSQAGFSLQGNGATNGVNDFAIFQFNNSTCYISQNASASLIFRTGGIAALTLSSSQLATFAGGVGVWGNSPPTQSTGWGTPTNASVQNNFAGSSATLAQTGAAVGQIIAVLKSIGILAT